MTCEATTTLLANICSLDDLGQ